MKIAKYFTYLMLITIVFIFIGELYVWHLDSFETDFKKVTFYLQSNTTQDEMIQDICGAAKTEKVEVFVVVKEVESIFSEQIHIYGTEGALDYLVSNSDIKSGTYNSVFLGNVAINFQLMKDIPDIAKIEDYYVIGNDDDIVSFKKDLIDKYAGKFPIEGYQAVNSVLSISMIWIIVELLLLLMTFFEIALKKKELIVRIVSGENIKFFVLKQLFLDIFIYTALLFLLKSILSRYTNTDFCSGISLVSLTLFLVFNSLLYLLFFSVDYKKDIKTKESAKKVLKISYFYKMATIVMTIIIMSGCMELIFNGINYYQQKDFFEKNKNYSYITFGLADYEEINEIMKGIYKKSVKSGEEISLVDLGNLGDGNEYILADRGAKSYLLNCIPMLKNIKFEDKVYFIMPKKYEDQDDVIANVQDVWSSYYKEKYEYEIFAYETNADIMSISNIGKVESEIKKNPIIILNNMPAKSLDSYWNLLYVGNSTMFKVSDDQWNTWIHENLFENKLYYRTNVYDNYMYHWKILKRDMFIGIVLFLILLLLEGSIIRTILNYEYNVNAVELSLKKVFGYRLFYRHKKIFFTTILLGMFSLIASLIVCEFLGFLSTRYIVLGGTILIISELLLVVIRVHKLENVNIYKIFKGGNL